MSNKLKLSNFGQFGLIRDLSEQSLPPETFTDVQNVKFTTDGVRTVLGDRRVMGTAPIEMKWGISAPPTDNPIFVLANEEQMYAYDGVTFSNITRLASPYTGSPVERWNAAVLNGLYIFNNTFDVPQLWPGFDIGVKNVDLPNWPGTLRCKSIRSFKQFLIAGNLREGASSFPFRIRWSHPARPGTVPQSWATDDPRFDSRQFDLGDTDDEFVDSFKLGEINCLYRERSVYGMQFVGGQDKFRIWRMIDDFGLLARDCVQSIPAGNVVFGQDDIFFHNEGRNSNISILHDINRKDIFRIISPENFRNCFTTRNQLENEIWFCLPESGATYPTYALTWNWKTAKFGYRDLDEIPWAVAGLVASSDDQTGEWG